MMNLVMLALLCAGPYNTQLAIGGRKDNARIHAVIKDARLAKRQEEEVQAASVAAQEDMVETLGREEELKEVVDEGNQDLGQEKASEEELNKVMDKGDEDLGQETDSQENQRLKTKLEIAELRAENAELKLKALETKHAELEEQEDEVDENGEFLEEQEDEAEEEEAAGSFLEEEQDEENEEQEDEAAGSFLEEGQDQKKEEQQEELHNIEKDHEIGKLEDDKDEALLQILGESQRKSTGGELFFNFLKENKGVKKKHLAAIRAARTHLVVVTDPRTDPTEDDATALAALIALNKIKPFAASIRALVTGEPGSLDARAKGIAFVKAKGGGTVEIEIAPSRTLLAGVKPPGSDSYWKPVMIYGKGAPTPKLDSNGHGNYNRMWGPYSNPDEAQAEYGTSGTGREQEGQYKTPEEKAHVVDRIPEETTALMVIGQVEPDFFVKLIENHKAGKLSNLKEFSLQGPGFNTLGPSFYMQPAEIVKFIEEYKLKKENVHFSDNLSNLMISNKDNEARFQALGYLNPKILEMKEIGIVSFWATSIKEYHFEGQMGDMNGYKYLKHTAKILRKLVKTSFIRALTIHIKEAAARQKLNPNPKSQEVLNTLKAQFENKGKLWQHFENHKGDRTKVVEAIRQATSKQGSRSYDELSAIEFALRKQGGNSKLMSGLGISVGDHNEKQLSKLQGVTIGLPAPGWPVTPGGTRFNYISMPDSKKTARRQRKCHKFHEFTNYLILSLSPEGMDKLKFEEKFRGMKGAKGLKKLQIKRDLAKHFKKKANKK